MVTNNYTEVLPGLEDMHVGLREITCECGCGETFFQTKVGRVKKYINAKHKAAAYRAVKSRTKTPIGEAIRELFIYSEQADHSEGYALRFLPKEAQIAIAMIADTGSIDLICEGLSQIEAYAAR